MGLSVNETDASKLAEVKDKLLSLKDNIKVYDSDSPKSQLISGDVYLSLLLECRDRIGNGRQP